MGMLDGKVALITGATSGIGARTAELFAAEGASVVFTGRRQVEGAAVAARIGRNAEFVAADATCEQDWKLVIDHTLKAFGRIDCLFNVPRQQEASPACPLRVSMPPWRCWCAR